MKTSSFLFALVSVVITSSTVTGYKAQNAATPVRSTKKPITSFPHRTIFALRGGELESNGDNNIPPSPVQSSAFVGESASTITTPSAGAFSDKGNNVQQQVATKSAKSFSSILTHPKVVNAIERTGPAILMLLFLVALLKYTKENGLIILIMALQIGMYVESINAIQSGEIGLVDNLEKWWWFATVFAGTTLRNVLAMGSQYDLAVFAMAVSGFVVGVMRMNRDPNAGPQSFKRYLNRYAGSNFALLFLLGQSSFWIKTIKAYGLMWTLYPALLVIVNDTMAYFFGILFGKHKLLPTLSPKKTVEGFIGAGLSTCIASIFLLKFFMNFDLKEVDKVINVSLCGGDDKCMTRHALIMAAYTSLISPFGGFFASATKRAHGIKDFGTFIPGHGGVIDRLDCQIVTAPFVFLYLKACLDK